jgi:hypothetical protein
MAGQSAVAIVAASLEVGDRTPVDDKDGKPY